MFANFPYYTFITLALIPCGMFETFFHLSFVIVVEAPYLKLLHVSLIFLNLFSISMLHFYVFSKG